MRVLAWLADGAALFEGATGVQLSLLIPVARKLWLPILASMPAAAARRWIMA